MMLLYWARPMVHSALRRYDFIHPVIMKKESPKDKPHSKVKSLVDAILLSSQCPAEDEGIRGMTQQQRHQKQFVVI